MSLYIDKDGRKKIVTTPSSGCKKPPVTTTPVGKPVAKPVNNPAAGTGKPVTGKPVTRKPVTRKPVTGKPVMGKPVTGKPVPSVKQPGQKPIGAKNPAQRVKTFARRSGTWA